MTSLATTVWRKKVSRDEVPVIIYHVNKIELTGIIHMLRDFCFVRKQQCNATGCGWEELHFASG